MKLASDWKDYEIIDCSNGEKLERWGDFYLLRPDPQIIWGRESLTKKYRGKIHAHYIRSNQGGGHWENLKSIPNRWNVSYKGLTFCIKQMGFKHTGLFPEQAINWDYFIDIIRKETKKREVKVLNLFAYTGGASVACLSAGASVVHVDSSRGMVDWAKENVMASGLEHAKIRYLVDDVVKFVNREIRRGNHYDAIILDPPSYGRGSNGEVWDFEKDLFPLLELCKQLLSSHPLFLHINSYTTGMSKEVLENILKILFKDENNAKITSFEIGLPIGKSNLNLPCGMVGRIEWNYE